MREYFSSKVALITGGSSGIGAEFAKQLHALGATIILVARRKEKMEVLTSTLNQIRPGSASFIVADLSNTNDLALVANKLRSEPIDILVNNAGRGSFGRFEELSLDEELKMVDLNVRATVVLAHAAIPRWKSQKAGMLFGIASVAGFQPLPYMATYSATKAFDLNHTVALWGELKRFGVRVTAVCPGPTDTEFAGVARVPGKFTGTPRDPVEVVVRKSIQAAEKGLPFVVPGLRSWFLSLGPRLLPLCVTTWLTEKVLYDILSTSRG
jgi:short-subunit dehydrogenase